MPDHLQLARGILQELVSRGPIKGAQLKTLLAHEFARRTGLDFSDALPSYPKFKYFLLANQDIVATEFPAGAGDVTVSAKENYSPGSWAPFRIATSPVPYESPALSLEAASPVSFELPRPLWKAFTNPDPRRRRFFQRSTREVVHYLEGSLEEPNPRIRAQVDANPADYVEISPATADMQSQWMREFVRTKDISPQTRRVLDALLSLPFSTDLNRSFVAALGELSEQWNRTRALKVREHVKRWADQNDLSFEDLSAKTTTTEELHARPMPFAPRLPAMDIESDLRRRIHLAIDTLSLSELRQLQLPATALLAIAPETGR